MHVFVTHMRGWFSIRFYRSPHLIRAAAQNELKRALEIGGNLDENTISLKNMQRFNYNRVTVIGYIVVHRIGIRLLGFINVP